MEGTKVAFVKMLVAKPKIWVELLDFGEPTGWAPAKNYSWFGGPKCFSAGAFSMTCLACGIPTVIQAKASLGSKRSELKVHSR